MIPSRRWFPGTLAERAAWYANFNSQFGKIAASLGFSADEIAAVSADNDVIQFLNQATTEMDAYEEAVRQFRINITEGDLGATAAQFPANPNFRPPVAVPTGIFERLTRLRTRIMAANDYTDEIGALLGIISTTEREVPVNDLKPVATATAAFGSYQFTVHATRMKMSAYQVQIRRMDSETWQDVAVSTTSDIEVTVAPKTPGQAERIQVRVVLLDKNKRVGQPSDALYLTINP